MAQLDFQSSKAFIPIGYGIVTPSVPSLQLTQFNSFAIPVLAICGQRVVIDLRRVKPTVYSTIGVSEEVDRQLSALSWNMQHDTSADNQYLSAIKAGDSHPDEEDTRIGSGENRNKP